MNKSRDEAEGVDPWESGELGRSEEFMKRAPAGLKAEIDDAFELQMISIRLQKQLLNDLKFIAEHRGIGYQPLVREVMSRFARSEMSAIARELQEQKQAREAIADSGTRPGKARQA